MSGPCTSPGGRARSPARPATRFEVRAVDIVRQRRPDAGDVRRGGSIRAAGAPPETTIDVRPGPHDRADERDLRVLGQRARRDVRSARSTAAARSRPAPRRRRTPASGRRPAHVHASARRTSTGDADAATYTWRITAGAGRRARSPAARSSSQSVLVHERPDRLPRQRPHHRHARHHDRPRTAT